MPPRQRADRLLVARGLFDSRARAQAAIAAGLVTADGETVHKAAQEIAVDAALTASPEHPFVSRGGVKLAAALDHFGVDVKERVCLDVGASTGGFTEVLLSRGAARVYAVDVGRDQLHPRLRGNDKLTSLEATDIRSLKPSRLSPRPDFAAVDVSFISLKLLLPSVATLLEPRATLLALIKPQFEAGRRTIKKGIVRDAAIHAAACNNIAAFIAAQGWRLGALMASPILGGDGNREFFVQATRG